MTDTLKLRLAYQIYDWLFSYKITSTLENWIETKIFLFQWEIW